MRQPSCSRGPLDCPRTVHVDCPRGQIQTFWVLSAQRPLQTPPGPGGTPGPSRKEAMLGAALGSHRARSLSDRLSYVGPPARLQPLPGTPYNQATPWSSQPACGRPTHAKSSGAQDGQLPYAASTNRRPASPSLSRSCRADARRSSLRRRTIATRRAPSGRRLTVPTSRPPPLAATGILG